MQFQGGAGAKSALRNLADSRQTTATTNQTITSPKTIGSADTPKNDAVAKERTPKIQGVSPPKLEVVQQQALDCLTRTQKRQERMKRVEYDLPGA